MSCREFLYVTLAPGSDPERVYSLLDILARSGCSRSEDQLEQRSGLIVCTMMLATPIPPQSRIVSLLRHGAALLELFVLSAEVRRIDNDTDEEVVLWSSLEFPYVPH